MCPDRTSTINWNVPQVLPKHSVFDNEQSFIENLKFGAAMSCHPRCTRSVPEYFHSVLHETDQNAFTEDIFRATYVAREWAGLFKHISRANEGGTKVGKYLMKNTILAEHLLPGKTLQIQNCIRMFYYIESRSSQHRSQWDHKLMGCKREDFLKGRAKAVVCLLLIHSISEISVFFHFTLI